MKPGDHPEFFRFPAPEGRSRESTIALDADGTFFHDGAPVEHDKLAHAMHSWISRHPDDGRFILTNGYDWTYFTVEDAPFIVRSIRATDDDVMLVLSDGTEEAWAPETTRVSESNAIYTRVKRDRPRAIYEAKFSRHAQLSLAPYLENDSDSEAAVEPRSEQSDPRSDNNDLDAKPRSDHDNPEAKPRSERGEPRTSEPRRLLIRLKNRRFVISA